MTHKYDLVFVLWRTWRHGTGRKTRLTNVHKEVKLRPLCRNASLPGRIENHTLERSRSQKNYQNSRTTLPPKDHEAYVNTSQQPGCAVVMLYAICIPENVMKDNIYTINDAEWMYWENCQKCKVFWQVSWCKTGCPEGQWERTLGP